MRSVTFTVTGVAQPKGSMKAFMVEGARFPTVTSDNPRAKHWQLLIGWHARAAHRVAEAARPSVEIFDGPIRVTLVFLLPRPKALGAKPAHHTKKPDIDKLTRTALDAMTGVLYRDDSQVVRLEVDKLYVAPGGQPGALITVCTAEENTHAAA
jgi:Holliday junction resolvase RusA-like endonuclease